VLHAEIRNRTCQGLD